MAFFDNMGKKLGEAAQAAAKKSGELVEVTKLNVNIGSEEDKMQKLYTQIGKKVYEKYAATGTVDEDLVEDCEAIRIHDQNVKGLKEKILEVKSMKQCTGCGAELERNQIFCSKCGTRNEVPHTAEPAQQAAPSSITCGACGATLQADSVFCTNCGSKVG